MKTRNGTARVTTSHPRRKPRLHEVKSSHKHHKKTPIDQSNFSEMSAIVMKYLEDALGSSKKNFLDGQLLSQIMKSTFKNYPIAALSSAAVAGGVVSFLLTRIEGLHHSSNDYSHYGLNGIKKMWQHVHPSPSLTSEILGFILMQIKDHSIEWYDEFMEHVLKKHPLQTMGGSLILGIVLTWLMRR